VLSWGEGPSRGSFEGLLELGRDWKDAGEAESVELPCRLEHLSPFTSGADAEELGKLSREDRLRVALAETTKMWQEAPRYWESAAVKYWNEDPWVQGSYTFLGVGQRGYRDLAGIAEGRVHFAGEHTAYSSMDGAISSGARVAEEIRALP